MTRRTIFPIIWPALFLLLCGMGDLGRLATVEKQLLLELEQQKQVLHSLRALQVADRINKEEYQQLLASFAKLTRLQATDPFRDPEAKTRGSTYVAMLVAGLYQDMREASSDPSEPDFLELQPVALIGQERLGPFVVTEFGLHFKGRYRAISLFLEKLARLVVQRKLVISIGNLEIVKGLEANASGAPVLEVTLSVRAYFRD